MILKKRLKIERVSSNLDSLNRGDWLNETVFKTTLKLEINRSFRTKQPLTHVIIRPFNGNKNKIDKNKAQEFLGIILATISENIRGIDVKAINDSDEINLILVDTALDGAKTFIEKIMNALIFEMRAAGKNEYISFIKDCHYSSFPLNQIAGTKQIEATPVLINNFELSNLRDTETTRLLINENQKMYINWDIQPNVDGTISIAHSSNFIDYLQSKREQLFIIQKRLFDIVFVLLSMVFLLPAMMVIGLAVKLTSEGPIFFKQQRVGQGGKLFTFLKFRSMVHNNNDDVHKKYVESLIKGDVEKTNNGSSDDPVYKITNDSRITPIGRFLRETSLDELPQFINVLLGDMSVVGPRPPIQYEVDVYKPWHLRRIQEAKPGITGMWQVYGRSSTTFNEMVRMDLNYVNNKSMILDIKLILKTISSVIKGRGAM